MKNRLIKNFEEVNITKEIISKNTISVNETTKANYDFELNYIGCEKSIKLSFTKNI